MKKLSFMILALFFGTIAFAQADQASSEKKAVDQYGNKVDIKDVTATERDGILVFESKDKD
ncbi:MAG: hypothetical protein J6T53_01890, partial [Bacteroidales bacterium]|nr:hypothetical protein [Bacteroidales bacterium]